MSGDPPAVAGTAIYDDPLLPGAAHLTGPGAAPLLAAALAEIGLEVRSASVEDVTHEPGRSCTVTYRVRVASPGSGSTGEEVVVATTSSHGPPEGAAILESDGIQVGLWRYPFDPLLPALAEAVVPELAGALLDRLVDTPGRGRSVDEVRVMTYRAGRRAVVRMRRAGHEVFVRSVRPPRAARLAAIHSRMVAGGVEVPPLLGTDMDAGVLVTGSLTAGGSRMLREAMADRTHDAVPDPGELVGVLDRMASVELDGNPPRRRPLDDVGAHVGALASVLPAQAGRLEELHGRLRVEDAGDPCAVGAGATVHGDLHDGQVVVGADGSVRGLLDLDDAGEGNRADDLGNLLGHVTTMASVLRESVGPRSGMAAARWAAGVHTDLAGLCGVDPDEVRRRGAAVALSLAVGPFRAREPRWELRTMRRLDAVEELLDSIDG